MAPVARVVLGEVVGPHGIRGALRVRLQGDDLRNLQRAERIELGAGAEDPHATEYRVREVRPGRSGEAVVELDEVTRREGAEALGGLIMTGRPENLESLPDGEYYWYQLVGCEVFDESGRGLGRLRGLLETGAHDVFVVEGEDDSERLYPAAAELLREIDLAARKIVIAVPEAAGVVEAESKARGQ